MADDVAVMYCGQVVEMSPRRTIFSDPEYMHPYTEGLFNSIPRLDTDVNTRLDSIPGAVPHPLDLPKGCKFAPRCKYCTQKCIDEEPDLVQVNEQQQIRCFYPETLGMTATTFVDEGYESYDDDPDFHEFGYLEQTDDEPTVSTTVGKFMPVLEKEGQM